MWDDFYTKKGDFYECDHCSFKVNDQRVILMHHAMCKELTTREDRKNIKITIQTPSTTYKWAGEKITPKLEHKKTKKTTKKSIIARDKTQQRTLTQDAELSPTTKRRKLASKTIKQATVKQAAVKQAADISSYFTSGKRSRSPLKSIKCAQKTIDRATDESTVIDSSQCLFQDADQCTTSKTTQSGESSYCSSQLSSLPENEQQQLATSTQIGSQTADFKQELISQ